MFYHVKELQFDTRVSGPDPVFAGMLLEQFGGGNGELKAAMQYFVQAFGARRAYPDKYDLLMDVATEELSHLEIVGATITMLLEGIPGELKDIAEQSYLTRLMKGRAEKEQLLHEELANPQFLVHTGGGPMLTDCNGIPWTAAFVNANGDLTVDLRSNIGAESRAKIVYEYLLQFTDDPSVKDTLRFLMSREIAHFQQFNAALSTIEPNFPPGVRQGDPRFTHVAFNMSTGEDYKGPWNEGQGTWAVGEHWEYVDEPRAHVLATHGLVDQPILGSRHTEETTQQMNAEISARRVKEIVTATPKGERSWSTYGNGGKRGTTRRK